MGFDAAANCFWQFFFDQNSDQFRLALRFHEGFIHAGSVRCSSSLRRYPVQELLPILMPERLTGSSRLPPSEPILTMGRSTFEAPNGPLYARHDHHDR
jgi:hypothetical protein